MGKFSKAFLWAITLTMTASVFTACDNSDTDSDTDSSYVEETTTTTEAITTEPPTESGIFVDFNEEDFSVDMSLNEIYTRNGVRTDDIKNVLDEKSGMYYEIDLNITSDNIDTLMDGTGAYVAELDIETCGLSECGDAVNFENNETSPVLIMFGDKKLLDTEYLNNTFKVDGSTKVLFVKGIFRGNVALYPMLFEGKGKTVYVFKPFLDMFKTW